MKINTMSRILSCIVLSLVLHQAEAQTPSDAIMMEKRQSCAAVIYEHSQFDHYWEGAKLRVNGTIETVKRDAVSPMIAIGILNRLNLLVGTSWVKTHSTEPNGGHMAGAQGFNDLALDLKGQLLDRQMGPGKLAFLLNAGFSTPITHYLSDYRPYSIGFGAQEYSLRGILQYRFDMGVYIRGAVAYLDRTQTKAERDYYYNNGSFYTAWMDVPSAWNYNAVVGTWLFDNQLKVEVNYMGVHSTSGDDIRAYNKAQPTNKVIFDQVGGLAQYYPKSLKGLGAVVYYSQVIDGRNTGKSTQLGGGLTYLFKF